MVASSAAVGELPADQPPSDRRAPCVSPRSAASVQRGGRGSGSDRPGARGGPRDNRRAPPRGAPRAPARPRPGRAAPRQRRGAMPGGAADCKCGPAAGGAPCRRTARRRKRSSSRSVAYQAAQTRRGQSRRAGSCRRRSGRQGARPDQAAIEIQPKRADRCPTGSARSLSSALSARRAAPAPDRRASRAIASAAAWRIVAGHEAARSRPSVRIAGTPPAPLDTTGAARWRIRLEHRQRHVVDVGALQVDVGLRRR